jgi:hypothetical protein
MASFPCRHCARILKSAGGRGGHERACKPAFAARARVAREAQARYDDGDGDMEMGNGDEDDADLPMAVADVDNDVESDASGFGDEDAQPDLPPDGDSDDDGSVRDLPGVPEVLADGSTKYVFIDRQSYSLRQTGVITIDGPLQRLSKLPAQWLTALKAIWHPSVGLTIAGIIVILKLLKDPLVGNPDNGLPSWKVMSAKVASTISRDKDPATVKKKEIPLMPLGFPARFGTCLFVWTCIISACVELLLDPRICKAENMQFECTYDGETFGELPSGSWWASEKVRAFTRDLKFELCLNVTYVYTPCQYY